MFRSKYKNVAYGITVNLNEDIHQRGVGLICLEENDKNIEGVKLLIDGNINFSLPKSELDKRIKEKDIVFIEILPHNIVQEMHAVWENNKLQNPN